MNNKIDHCDDDDFSKKCGHGGGEKSENSDQWGGGSENEQKFHP